MSLSRRFSKNSRSSSSQYFSPAERDLSSTDEHNSYPPPPKHIPFPDIPQASEILNEFFMFTFATISAGLQFLNLYRTVFWLPESYNKQIVVKLLYCCAFNISYYHCIMFCYRTFI